MEDVELGNSLEEDRVALESRQENSDAVVLDAAYDVPWSKIRDLVFLDRAEDGVYNAFLREMSYFDIKVGDFGQEGQRERVVSFKISSPMGSVGPKEVDAEDTQIIVLENACGLIMESSCKTSKVMYSNSFRVCVQHKVMQAADSPQRCRLRCTLHVNFIKSVMGMIKKQIRTETVKQMHRKYSMLSDCINRALAPGSNPPAAEVNGNLSTTPSLDADGPGPTPAGEPAGTSLGHRRNVSSTNLQRDTSKSESKVTGWLLKRSNTLRKWNTRYCEFDFASGRFEWRKRPDDMEPNGFMMINRFTEIQNKGLQRGVQPHGMEECGFIILYENKKYHFSADTERASTMWCTAMKEYVQKCTSVLVNKRTSFDDSPTMMVQFSLREAVDLHHLQVNLDDEKKSERRAYFRMSVGHHIKRSKTVRTGKSTCGAWNQTFCFPIVIDENPELHIKGEECFGDGPYEMGKAIGMCSLPLWAFPPDQPVKFWACLRSSGHISSPISGKVQVHLLITETVHDWEDRDSGDLFHEPVSLNSTSVKEGTDGMRENSRKENHSLLSLLCCGLRKGRKPAEQKYQLLEDLDDL